MGNQESVTLDEGNRRMGGGSGDGEPGAAAGGQGPGGAGGLAGRWIARFRSLSRGRRLAITTTAGVLAVVAAITAIGSTSGGAAKAPAHPQAPAFTLSALGSSGGHISLAGFAGKPLIINFFASWCEPCQKETPLLARFYRAAHGSVTLIGIDANDKASAALKFIHAAGVSYRVAFDPYPMHTTISFGVDALPQTFFLDAQHRIVKLVRGAVTEQELRAGVAQITGQTRG
jgi:cytochrome c biogenesis protein CcmG/thiol:disulfide interchange protein DsbE